MTVLLSKSYGNHASKRVRRGARRLWSRLRGRPLEEDGASDIEFHRDPEAAKGNEVNIKKYSPLSDILEEDLEMLRRGSAASFGLHKHSNNSLKKRKKHKHSGSNSGSISSISKSISQSVEDIPLDNVPPKLSVPSKPSGAKPIPQKQEVILRITDDSKPSWQRARPSWRENPSPVPPQNPRQEEMVEEKKPGEEKPVVVPLVVDTPSTVTSTTPSPGRPVIPPRLYELSNADTPRSGLPHLAFPQQHSPTFPETVARRPSGRSAKSDVTTSSLSTDPNVPKLFTTGAESPEKLEEVESTATEDDNDADDEQQTTV